MSTYYAKALLDFGVYHDSGYLSPLVQKTLARFATAADAVQVAEVSVDSASSTAILRGTWTAATDILIINDSGANIIVNGSAGTTTGITVATGGFLFVTKAAIATAGINVYQSSGSAKVITVVAFGT